MIFQGRFRTVRHKDHAVPVPMPRPVLGHESFLDIRAWRKPAPAAPEEGLPLLLVTTPRKTGSAVRRNHFRRQVRMAFLGCAGALPLQGWTIWVRPARNAPSLHLITFQAIEAQLMMALHRLPASGTP